MATDMLDIGAETPGEELRFQSLERAAQACQRAKALRSIIVLATFAVSMARVTWPALFKPLGGAPSSEPAVLGFCLFASFFAISLEWSTRMHCQNCCERYEAYRRAR